MSATSDGGAASKARRLHLAFEDPKAFVAEYAQNLARGGAMIASNDAFELREIVNVLVEVPFASAKLALRAEVVHAGGGSVAVQFLDPTPELRARLEPLREKAEQLAAAEPAKPAKPKAPPAKPAAKAPKAKAKPAPKPPPTPEEFTLDPEEEIDLDGIGLEEVDGAALQGFESTSQAPETDPNERTYRERANRAPARVAAAVRAPTGKQLKARTRDVSTSGMLLTVDADELPLGREVQVSMVHPTTGEQLTLPAKVVRHLEKDGVVGAVAVEIASQALNDQVERFVAEVQEVDAKQRSSGIRGPLDELGGASLLQMFSALSKRGTLTVSQGVEEGVVVFEDGVLRIAQVGAVAGVKALARILSWRDGFFEFRTHVDPIDTSEASMPMEGAILEAVRMLDEDRRSSGAVLDPTSRLEVQRAKLAETGPPLGKTEQAVLELATAGFTVRRILDVIPENDAMIRSAILALVERGLVRLV
jgi:hypothetical protein